MGKRREARMMRRDIYCHYKKEKNALKERCIGELYGFYDRIGIPRPIDPPARHRKEEIANAVSHAVGAVLSVLALGVMLTKARGSAQILSAIVYFLGLFAVFFSSSIYHALSHGTRAKRVARRFDYASVYILIGATFLPIVLTSLSPTSAGLLLLVQWLIIACGASSAVILGPERVFFIHIALYLLLGWSALLLLPSMSLATPMLAPCVFGGGVLFTLGVIPCAMKCKGAHFVWHLFVLFGVCMQWSGVQLLFSA